MTIEAEILNLGRKKHYGEIDAFLEALANVIGLILATDQGHAIENFRQIRHVMFNSYRQAVCESTLIDIFDINEAK